MYKKYLVSVFALGALTACETVDGGTSNPVGADAQDRICAERLASQTGVDFNSVRANSRDTSPSGNSVVFVQSGFYRYACEITDGGFIVSFNDISG